MVPYYEKHESSMYDIDAEVRPQLLSKSGLESGKVVTVMIEH